MKSDKDASYKQTKSRPGYMLDMIDICCRFWKLCCALIRNWPHVYIRRWAQILYLKPGKSSLWLINIFWIWNFPHNIYETSVYHCNTWNCLNYTYLSWIICWRIDLCRAEPLNCQVRMVKLHSRAPRISLSQKLILYFVQSLILKAERLFLMRNVFCFLKWCAYCNSRLSIFANIVLA